MRRPSPQVHWRAVLIGGAVALVITIAVSLVAETFRLSGLHLAATPLGLAAGGAAAGRISRVFGALQGGMVAVLWIIAEALADAFAPASANALADVALIIAADAARIAIAALFGWLGARS